MADAQGNRYGPYDIEVVGSEAEAFTEEAWFDAFGWITGVRSGADLTFTGLTATLSATVAKPLNVWSHGGYLIRTTPPSVASPPTPSGGNPRRDLLVARRQRTSGSGGSAVPGKTFLQLIQGTPAATPVDPPFDAANDEPLFSWQVPGNGGTVVTGVRDLRRLLAADGSAHWLHGVELHSTLSTAVGSGVSSGLAFPTGSASFDSDGYFTGPNSLNILTIPAGLGGLYCVSHRVQLDSVVPGRFFADANAVAGGNKVSRANGTGDDIAQSSRPMRLAAGDVFNLNGYHEASGTLNVVSRSLSLHLIGT